MPPVKRIRTLAVVLIALTSLAACGSEDGSTEAAPPAAGTSASAPASSGPASSAAATSAPAQAEPSGGATALCQQADEARKKLTTLLAEAFSGSQPDPAKVQKAMADLGKDLTEIGSKGGTNEAAVAMKEYGIEVTKAAATGDPAEAPNAAAVEKAGERVDAICAKA